MDSQYLTLVKLVHKYVQVSLQLIFIKQKCEGNKSQLLFTDTDSLVYSIKTEYLHDMYEDKSEFDFSGYSDNSPYYSVENKQKSGK